MPLCSERNGRRVLRVEAADVLECWVLSAKGSVRPGGNTMSRKDTGSYKKGNQIAGSLLAGWEQCESDLQGPLFIPQLGQAVCSVQGAGWPPHGSGRWGPHSVGGNISARDERWGAWESKGPGGQ